MLQANTLHICLQTNARTFRNHCRAFARLPRHVSLRTVKHFGENTEKNNVQNNANQKRAVLT